MKKFTEQDKSRLMSKEAGKNNGKIPTESVAKVAQRKVDEARTPKGQKKHKAR